MSNAIFFVMVDDILPFARFTIYIIMKMSLNYYVLVVLGISRSKCFIPIHLYMLHVHLFICGDRNK